MSKSGDLARRLKLAAAVCGSLALVTAALDLHGARDSSPRAAPVPTIAADAGDTTPVVRDPEPPLCSAVMARGAAELDTARLQRARAELVELRLAARSVLSVAPKTSPPSGC